MGIAWDETQPSDGDLLSQFAQLTRSLKTAVATGVGQSMYWPGSGGGSTASAGQMKLGTLVAIASAGVVSAASAVPNTGALLVSGITDAKLFVFAVSNTTFLIGTRRAIEHQSTPTQRARWVESFGTAAPGSARSYGVVYGAVPWVQVSLVDTVSSDTAPATYFSALTTGGFTAEAASGVSALGTSVLHWYSLGTVSF